MPRNPEIRQGWRVNARGKPGLRQGWRIKLFRGYLQSIEEDA